MPARRYRPPPFASTFPDVDTAERAIVEVLSRHEREAEEWLASGGRRCRVEEVLDWTVGRSMDPSGMAQDVAGVRVVLERDPSMPDGFLILTAFPQPPIIERRHGSVDTPALENLLGAYFHQDWFDEHGDEWATLDDFLEGEPQLAPLVPREINRVLDEMPTEDEVDSFLESLGSCYTTTPEQGGYRGWLAEISRRVAAATGQTNSN